MLDECALLFAVCLFIVAFKISKVLIEFHLLLNNFSMYVPFSCRSVARKMEGNL